MTDSQLEAFVVSNLLAIQKTSQDQDFLRSVLKLYMDHTLPLVFDLVQAMNERSIKKIRHLAHRIKGSSASIGAARMVEICVQIEAIDFISVSDNEIQVVVEKLQIAQVETATQIKEFC